MAIKAKQGGFDMKRTIILAILVSSLLTLIAACGASGLSKPKNGTYQSSGIISQTWTFTGSNSITLSTVGGLISSNGTYEISGNTMNITSSLLGVETTSSYTITEITSNSFFINGEKFVKQ